MRVQPRILELSFVICSYKSVLISPTILVCSECLYRYDSRYHVMNKCFLFEHLYDNIVIEDNNGGNYGRKTAFFL